MNALGAGRRSARIRLRARPIELVIIKAPFPHVPRHVLDSERTGAERKRADRRTFRIAVVDFAIAPGKDGVAVREVREVAATVIISPRELSIINPFGGVFPFRFSRQAIFAPFAGAKPLTELPGIEITDVNDRVS